MGGRAASPLAGAKVAYYVVLRAESLAYVLYGVATAYYVGGVHTLCLRATGSDG